jgi:hypothetical protein
MQRWKMQTQKPIPNKSRAIVAGKIATVYKGQRIVKSYNSGQPLTGKIPEDDAPPFTGFVRGWFRKDGMQ